MYSLSFLRVYCIYVNKGFINNEETCLIFIKYPSKMSNHKVIQNNGIININGEVLTNSLDFLGCNPKELPQK